MKGARGSNSLVSAFVPVSLDGALIRKVKVISFHFSKSFAKEDVAFLQYKLLSNPCVLQAHLARKSNSGIAIVLLDFNFSFFCRSIGLKPVHLHERIISYKEMLLENALAE
jgi:hypothetical protein